MSDPINFDDTEFCTPQQAAEARKMKAELPLWAEFAQPATQGVITPETTIDAAQVGIGVEAPADVPSVDFAKIKQRDNPWQVITDLNAWLDAVDAHRALNGTTGQESEP